MNQIGFEDNAPWTCPECGIERLHGGSFCPVCGRPVDDTLYEKYGCLDADMREEFADDESTDPELLVALAMDADYWISSTAKRNPSLPPSFLSNIEYGMLDGALLSHPNVPEEVLRRYAAHEDEWLRVGVARNPSAQEDLLRTLAQDESTYVRGNVGMNPKTPEDVLFVLTHDGEMEVRRHLACSTNLPEALFRELACDKRAYIRRGVACNKFAPAEVLTQLARDNQRRVRRNVAENAAASNAALEILAQDKVTEIASLAARFLAIRRAD